MQGRRKLKTNRGDQGTGPRKASKEYMNTHFDEFGGISHSDSRSGPIDVGAEYRTGYQDGLSAKQEHPDWQVEDARHAAGDYSTVFLMNDRQALERFDGFYDGAMGNKKKY